MSVSPPGFGFSLKALLIAPLPVPFLASACFAIDMEGGKPLPVFLIFSLLGLVVSGLGTFALALCLWLVGLVRPVTGTLSAIIGLALGAVGFLAFAWINWKSSGPDSGPPDETFAIFLQHEGTDFFAYVFLGGGLLTALLYHAIASRSTGNATRMIHRAPPAPATRQN